MKQNVLFSIIAIIAMLGNVVHANEYLSKRLLGTWDCTTTHVESGMTIKSEAQITYVRNGTSNQFGETSLTLPADFLPEKISLVYLVTATGTWEITDGKFLVETSTDVKVTRASFLEDDLESLFSNSLSKEEIQEIKQMLEVFDNVFKNLPTGMSESSEISSFKKNKLVLVSESMGSKTLCTRKKNN